MIDPTYYTDLIDKYKPYLSTHSPIPLPDLDYDKDTEETTVKVTFEFIPHPDFGATKLRVRDWYDGESNHVRYRYCWEVNRTPTGNISAWENEHPHDGLTTNPHHNHHVPYNRKPVQDNHSIRTLSDALAFIIPYIRDSKPYP